MRKGKLADLWVVHCKGCGLNYPPNIKGYRGEYEFEAIEAWNRRAGVVRCKDCKHYFHYGDGVYGCRTYGMIKTEHDGFCSQGERKGNGT
jgi:hypothetical protein